MSDLSPWHRRRFGHNRVGRNIRDAIGHKLPAGTPCDVYRPQDAIETVGGAVREPVAFIACACPPRDAVVVPAPIVVFKELSPGRENRRRDQHEKVDDYQSVPTILRYGVVESEHQGYQVFWREPGDREWRRETPETPRPTCVRELGIELTLEEVYAGIDFDQTP